MENNKEEWEEWIHDIDNYIDYHGEADKEDIAPFIRRDLLKSFISKLLQDQKEGIRKRIKELGHQQEDDTIWLNMDDLLTSDELKI